MAFLSSAIHCSMLQSIRRLREMVDGVDVTAESIIDIPRADGIRKRLRAIVRHCVVVRAISLISTKVSMIAKVVRVARGDFRMVASI